MNTTTTFWALILPKIIFESRIVSQNKKTQKQNSDVEINFILVGHFFGLVFFVGKVLLPDMLDVLVALHPWLLDVWSLETFEARHDTRLARRFLAGAVELDFGLNRRRNRLVCAVALHVSFLSHSILILKYNKSIYRWSKWRDVPGEGGNPEPAIQEEVFLVSEKDVEKSS